MHGPMNVKFISGIGKTEFRSLAQKHLSNFYCSIIRIPPFRLFQMTVL